MSKTPCKARRRVDSQTMTMYPKPSRKPRKTAKKVVATPSKDYRMAVFGRSGFKCERCGKSLGGGEHVSVHHRSPRGMGGTHDAKVNSFSNLMALCGSGTTGCHGWIEKNRAIALEEGWLVSKWGDPSTTPVNVNGKMVYLTEEGGYGRV